MFLPRDWHFFLTEISESKRFLSNTSITRRYLSFSGKWIGHGNFFTLPTLTLLWIMKYYFFPGAIKSGRVAERRKNKSTDSFFLWVSLGFFVSAFLSLSLFLFLTGLLPPWWEPVVACVAGFSQGCLLGSGLWQAGAAREWLVEAREVRILVWGEAGPSGRSGARGAPIPGHTGRMWSSEGWLKGWGVVRPRRPGSPCQLQHKEQSA